MGCEEHVCCGYRSGSPDEWEVLEINSVPSSIRGEDEEDEENCFSLDIELGSLINSNYFACPLPEYNPEENLAAKSLAVVDDGSRVRIPGATPGSTDLLAAKEAEENLAAKEAEQNSGPLVAKEAVENSGVLATGRVGSGVIEGLCIIQPLVVTELAMFRVNSSFNLWKAASGEEEGLKVVVMGDCNNNNKISSNPSSPRVISSPCSPRVISSPSSPRAISSNAEAAKCKAGKANFIDQLGIWRKRVGMLSSFGMAAAVMGLVILGQRFYMLKANQNKNRNQALIRFQISGDNRRFNRLMSQAARLNEALSSAKGGVPVVRAHISFGGYCDGL